MSEIVLYGPNTAPFTRKVVFALRLKKLPYEHREPQSPEDYQRWSPKTGLLPAIEVDGTHQEDSGQILDLLDERFPEVPLVSADPKTARQQRGLEQWAEAAFMYYWIHYLRGIVDPEESETPPRPSMRGEFAQRLDDLVNFLGGRPYFYADLPGRADLAVWSWLDGVGEAVGPAVGPEVGDAVEARPLLQEHGARVRAAIGR